VTLAVRFGVDDPPVTNALVSVRTGALTTSMKPDDPAVLCAPAALTSVAVILSAFKPEVAGVNVIEFVAADVTPAAPPLLVIAPLETVQR
jgi:hypothetical protein